MGRKNKANSEKHKEKRKMRKEEQQRISSAMAAVEKANKLEDPLEPFVAFRKFNKSDVNVEFYVKRATQLDESITSWAFNLTKKNMRLKYALSSWGWSDAEKSAELTDDAAWYLVANSSDGTCIGFSHFRFDIDEGIEVLYCYELQIESFMQRKGLGKFMMLILELIAFKNQMRKVVLTVLKNNQFSRFFKAIGYEIDESCPIDDDEETFPYEILSKINKSLPPLSAGNRSNHSHSHSNGHCCSGHHH